LRLVYYSLAVSQEGRPERQWGISVRSLRRHNKSIPIYLFVYGAETPASVREVAAHGNVTVCELGRYDAYLKRISPHGSMLALSPLLHKILSLRHLPDRELSQVLYLDCDTFFLDDVEKLFDRYGSCDWYAREEPCTSRSRSGADPLHVDEDALRRIARAEGLRPIAPFNSGVWLLNNASWRSLDRLGTTFLDVVWRLVLGWDQKTADLHSAMELRIAAALADAAAALDRSRALPYPAGSLWMVDQIALWLLLGGLPLSGGLLDEHDVPQGDDALDAVANGRGWIVAHYFRVLENAFFEVMGSPGRDHGPFQPKSPSDAWVAESLHS
jgi:hypothetical protein